MKFIDANIFLRYLLWDDPAKAEACRKLFKKAIEGREQLWTTPLVVAEIIWVLESVYKHPLDKVADAVLQILNVDNLHVEHKELLMESVGLYKLKNIDFIDAYNAVFMLEKGIKTIYSYDRDFDKIKPLHRQEP